MRILCEAGVAASAVLNTMDLFHDPHLAARGFVEQVEHPVEGTVTLLGSPIRMSESEVALQPAPILGEHSDEVLISELGLSEEELSRLRDEGVVHSQPGAAFAASVEQ